MATFNEIPLTPDNQSFSIALAGTVYRLRLFWREPYWMLDIQDSSGSDIINGIPLVTGADLLAQYAFMGLGFSLMVACDNPAQDMPTQTDLGSGSHLYVITE